MNDYISRKAAIDCLYSTMESYYIKRNIMDFPAADVRPVVRGKLNHERTTRNGG